MVDFPGDPSPASSLIPVEGEIKRIVLPGLMGAGKSTVGRLFADLTGRDFLDLDIHIETTTDKHLDQLFDATE